MSTNNIGVYSFYSILGVFFVGLVYFNGLIAADTI